MGKLENFRKVLAMPEVKENVELLSKLKDIYTDCLELLDENQELKAKLKEAEDVADIKKNAKVYSGFYTLDGVKDAEGEEIPFCLNCLYEHKLQIPMMFGVVERGLQDMLTGRIFKENTYGFTCQKCGTKLAVNKQEKK